MERNLTQIKFFIATIFGTLTSFLGVLAIPIYILVAENIIDYFTGILASANRGKKISSKQGIRGIIRKICMWILIFVGVLLDQIVIYTSSVVGINVHFTFLISCIVALWLCVNEMVSILENLKDVLGEDMPSFLIPLTKGIRSQVEEKFNTKEDK